MSAPTVRLDSAQSAARVAIATALAHALVCGIDNAAEEGHPLTQLQQVDLAVSAMLAAHTAIRDAEANLATDADLQRLARTQGEEARMNACVRPPGQCEWCGP